MSHNLSRFEVCGCVPVSLSSVRELKDLCIYIIYLLVVSSSHFKYSPVSCLCLLLSDWPQRSNVHLHTWPTGSTWNLCAATARRRRRPGGKPAYTIGSQSWINADLTEWKETCQVAHKVDEKKTDYRWGKIVVRRPISWTVSASDWVDGTDQIFKLSVNFLNCITITTNIVISLMVIWK